MNDEEINPDDYDDDIYDVEAIKIDLSNNNFSPDDIEDYRHENIVRMSMINGQYTQAKNQCREFGLNYEVELLKYKHGINEDD